VQLLSGAILSLHPACDLFAVQLVEVRDEKQPQFLVLHQHGDFHEIVLGDEFGGTLEELE